MNANPVNLAVRFLLELCILIAYGMWGWHLGVSHELTWVSYVAAIGLPLIAAALWGIFRIPNDPNPAPVAIPGQLRLLLEWGLFGSSVWMLYRLGYSRAGLIMGVIVVIHYMVSYDRAWAMLRNKPYVLKK